MRVPIWEIGLSVEGKVIDSNATKLNALASCTVLVTEPTHIVIEDGLPFQSAFYPVCAVA